MLFPMVYCMCECVCVRACVRACERESGCGERVLLQSCVSQSFFCPDLEQNMFKLTNTCAKFNVTKWYANKYMSTGGSVSFSQILNVQRNTLKLSTY